MKVTLDLSPDQLREVWRWVERDNAEGEISIVLGTMADNIHSVVQTSTVLTSTSAGLNISKSIHTSSLRNMPPTMKVG